MYLKKRLETIFHKTIRKTGYDLVKCKFSRHELEIEQLMNHYNISTVLDVGANIGQYAKSIRIGGFKKRIISFEPLKDAFLKLESLSKNDPKWDVYNLALGDTDGKAEINISGNSVSSSFLKIKKAHIDVAPASEYIGKQEIEIRKLDTIFNDLKISGNNVYLKIDTQGFEKNVLVGAVKSLNNISTIQLEMSVQVLYEGEELYYQISDYLYRQGYRLIKIVRGYTKPDGELLQFDGIFRRN